MSHVTFLPHLWSQATAGLDLEKTLELRSRALEIKRLSRTPDVTALFEEMALARDILTTLSSSSPLSFFWPQAATPGELFDWLNGLVDYVELPGSFRQTPTPTLH